MLSPSCVHKEFRIAQRFSGIDPEIKPYVEDFINLSKNKLNDLSYSKTSIGIEPQAGNRIGVCYRFVDGTSEIAIDGDFFNSESQLRKQALVFHELVHCICNRSHDHNGIDYEPIIEPNKSNRELLYFEDGCSRSIMSPELTSTQCLEKRWSYYIEEMFSRCSPYE
jgi:hypothetical protein